MNTLEKIVIFYTIIRIVLESIKNWRWSIDPLYNLILLLTNISLIIIQISIIYTCPLIFVSLIIITDPLFHKLISIQFHYLFD
jgi:uncharacterized membrane protein